MTKIQEGYMPFGEYKTYYRIVGKERTIPLRVDTLNNKSVISRGCFE